MPCRTAHALLLLLRHAGMLLTGARAAQDLKSPNILVDANWRIKVAVRARGLAPACRRRADRTMLCGV